MPHTDPVYSLDRLQLGPTGPHRALYNKKYTPMGPTNHTVHTWNTTNKKMGWHNIITQATPLWVTDRLGRLENSKGFRNWDLIGISTVGYLWKKGRVITFAELKKQYQLAPTEHFSYRQIKHALEAIIPLNTTLPQASPLEDRLLTDYLDK